MSEISRKQKKMQHRHHHYNEPERDQHRLSFSGNGNHVEVLWLGPSILYIYRIYVVCCCVCLATFLHRLFIDFVEICCTLLVVFRFWFRSICCFIILTAYINRLLNQRQTPLAPGPFTNYFWHSVKQPISRKTTFYLNEKQP